MTKKKKEYIKAKEKYNQARNAFYKAETKLFKSSDIQEFDTVKIIANANPKEKEGNKAIGKIQTVNHIFIGSEGEILYTLDWQDKDGQLWCWKRKELKLIKKYVQQNPRNHRISPINSKSTTGKNKTKGKRK